jgi:hypothetical protein
MADDLAYARRLIMNNINLYGNFPIVIERSEGLLKICISDAMKPELLNGGVFGTAGFDRERKFK